VVAPRDGRGEHGFHLKVTSTNQVRDLIGRGKPSYFTFPFQSEYTALDGPLNQYASLQAWQLRRSSCDRLADVVLAVAVDIARLRRVGQPRALVRVQRWVRVQAFRHLVTDHIYKSLKHSPNIDILLGRSLKEVETKAVSELFAPLV